jgi:hypothetical protein
MLDAKTLLERQYHEMRWRILSLAADLDRLQRAAGGEALLRNDLRIANLQKCIEELRSGDLDRAERVQMHLSDRTPDPRKELR